ncbi:hypothetical protein ABXV18_24635 [Vibrio owensii]|uniref:hypothetical protein n=1 Tax=Vibrio owensii TaxID=696485 RepID=UPI0033987041
MTETAKQTEQEQAAEQAQVQENQISQQVLEQLRQIPLLNKTLQILEAEITVHRREKAEMALFIEQQGQEIQQLRTANANLAQDCNESTGE